MRFWRGTAVIDRVLAQIGAFPPEIAISAFMDVGNYDAARAFEAVKVPIVAVNGDLFPTNFEANRRHAPQFDALIMKGVGHFPMLEDPARFGALLDEALRKVEGAAPNRTR